MYIVFGTKQQMAKRVNSFREAGDLMRNLQFIGLKPSFVKRADLLNFAELPLIINDEEACYQPGHIHSQPKVII